MYSSGYTSNSNDFGKYGPANGASEIEPASGGGILDSLPRSGYWDIRIGTMSLTLNLDNYQSGDLYIDYNVESRSMSVSVAAAPGPAYSGPSPIDNKYEIQLLNSFADYSNGSGLFNYDGSSVNNSLDKRVYLYSDASNFPHTVEAVTGLSQIYPAGSNTPWIFNNWSDEISSDLLSFDLQSATNIRASANFIEGYKVTFKNSYGSAYTDGSIYCEGSQRISPYTLAIFKTASTSASAVSQNKFISGINNYISLTFDHWSTSLPVTPTQNDQTYYCYLKGKPVHGSRYLQFNDGSTGSFVQLTWSAFNDPDITGYQVWRMVKHNGVLGDPVMIANLSGRNTTSYTDYDYVITASLVDLLKYDVRAVYDPQTFNGWDQSATTTDEDYETVYGEMSLMTLKENNMQASLLREVPSDYNIENYPNPFNPTTKITYQLPEKSNVVLKIYDALGKEIRTLVNSTKEAGYYNIDFDASDLPSGVYIYRIQAGKFNQSKKMLLVK